MLKVFTSPVFASVTFDTTFTFDKNLFNIKYLLRIYSTLNHITCVIYEKSKFELSYPELTALLGA